MKIKHKLFPRIAAPILLMGIVLALIVLLTAAALQKRLHQNELADKAQIVATTLESSAEIFASAAELMDYIGSIGNRTTGLKSVAVVDPGQGLVVAATEPAWQNQRISRIPFLANLADTRQTTRIETQSANQSYGFVVPVVLKNRSLLETFDLGDSSSRYLAVIELDDMDFGGYYEDAAGVLLTVVGLGALLVFFGTFLVVKRQVLDPVNHIHDAIRMRENQPGPLNLPDLAPDEIGQLARLLDESLQQISETGELMSVMSRAIEGSSNEVYVLEQDGLRFVNVNKAGLDNLGYTLDEMLSMTGFEIAPDLSDELVAADLEHQLATQQEIRHTYEHVRKDGSCYLFEFKGMLVEGGRRNLMITLGSDISDRRAQEEALRLSEERMALALEGSHEGLFDYHIITSQIYISEFVQRWLGVTKEQLDINEFVDRVAVEDRGRVQAAMQRAVDHSREVNVEFRVGAENFGQQRWLQVRGQVQSEAGLAHRLSGFVSDISRRKIAENLLNTSVTRLGAVLDHIADGIITLTDDGVVCTVNPRAMAMFDMTKSELAGSLLHQRLQSVEEDVIQQLPSWEDLADGPLQEIRATRGNGSEFVGEIEVTRMELVSDERYTVVLRDISERKENELALRQAMLEAQEATQAKGEFLATMSHEIRTPMNGVLGMTQLLLDTDLNPEQRETAELIFSSGDVLLTLINDILDYSKIEAGRLELEHLPFDMRRAIKEVMDLLAATARSKNLDLYVDYAEDVPFSLKGDVGRLRQVLLNLIGNAIKFTNLGHVLVKVEALDVWDNNARLKVSVIDTGPGVALDKQAKLFDSFTQADTSITRKFGGTGLGLAICKQLVELMQGEIGVISREGEGAEFWFNVVLPMCDEVPDQHQDEQRMNFTGRRMLAVDDNTIGLEIVRRMGESFGVDVVTTGDPTAVMPLMDKEYREGRTLDVIALDYHMPELDGLSLAEAIRGDQRYAQCKIILLTSSDINPPDIVDGYGLKPIMRVGLARLLHSVLYGDDGQREAPASNPGPVAQNTRVLLAEDNPVNQRVAVRMLEKIGCTVDVAADGREAVDMWQQFPYAIVFMDCQMPELDGLSATKRIRELEREEKSDRTPIVAMTANAMAKDKEECLRAGMDDYASKPIKIALLAELVQRWARPVVSGGLINSNEVTNHPPPRD